MSRAGRGRKEWGRTHVGWDPEQLRGPRFVTRVLRGPLDPGSIFCALPTPSY